jgi:hypothetical protein
MKLELNNKRSSKDKEGNKKKISWNFMKMKTQPIGTYETQKIQF